MTEDGAVQVRILGCGDPFGSGGRMQTSFLVTHSAGQLLIDCGTSTLIAMAQQGVLPDGVDLVVLTHLHGDHFGGLPFLLLQAQHALKRTRPLAIAGPTGTRERLERLMESSFPGSWGTRWRFDLAITEIVPDERQSLGDVMVSAIEGSHPSGAPSLAVRVDVEGRAIAYSGDTAWVEALIEIARGSDLFIAECYRVDPGVPYHLNHGDLARHRNEFQARRVLLTHLGTDPLAREAELIFDVAHDGMVIDL